MHLHWISNAFLLLYPDSRIWNLPLLQPDDHKATKLCQRKCPKLGDQECEGPSRERSSDFFLMNHAKVAIA
jgi:hypothetical protein